MEIAGLAKGLDVEDGGKGLVQDQAILGLQVLTCTNIAACLRNEIKISHDNNKADSKYLNICTWLHPPAFRCYLCNQQIFIMHILGITHFTMCYGTEKGKNKYDYFHNEITIQLIDNIWDFYLLKVTKQYIININ